MKYFFLPVEKSHSHVLCQDAQALETRWSGLLLMMVFSNPVKPQGHISWPVWPLRGISKAAWDAN